MVDSRAASRYASVATSNTHKRCSKCGKLVLRSSMRCRRCGQRQRWSRRKMLLTSSLIMVAAMFAIAAHSTLSQAGRGSETFVPTLATHATPSAQHAARVANATPVTASDLWAAYMRDPAAADSRFRDRSLVVRGLIRSIEKDFSGEVLVRLSAGEAMDTVNAKLAIRDDPAMVNLSKGREISLLCVGRGAVIGAPQLGSCLLSS